MAIALVAHAGRNNSDYSTLTFPSINTTGANLLVVILSEFNASITSITDTYSNTWARLTVYGLNISIWYAKNASVGTGHVIIGNSLSYLSGAVAAFSGVDITSPFDQQNGSSDIGTSTVQPGSITPSVDGELVVTGAYSTYASSTYTIDGSYTVTDATPNTDSVPSTGLAYWIQTTATATNPTWSLAAYHSGAAIASFKAASGGGGGSTLLRPNAFIGQAVNRASTY